MSQRSETVLEGLKKAYTAYFDIEEINDGTALKARCDYHMRDSQYVLVKKAELWAAESHEYLYLWDAGALDTAGVEEIFRRTLEDGEPRVRPHAQHMYTYLTAVALYDSADPDALAQLKKLKKRREFPSPAFFDGTVPGFRIYWGKGGGSSCRAESPARPRARERIWWPSRRPCPSGSARARRRTSWRFWPPCSISCAATWR